MPPVFGAKFTIDQSLLDALRQLPERAQQNLRRRMQTELAPKLQVRANELFGADPGPVSEPFVFGNSPDAAARSHNAYMAIVREVQGANDPNGHWIRTGIIEEGFRISISDRLRASLIRLTNVQPKSRYVLGPWQVAGHANTGWGKQFAQARMTLRQEAIVAIMALWKQALNDTIAEGGKS